MLQELGVNTTDAITMFLSQAKHELLQEVMRDVKSLAVDRNRPVLISVQINREGKKGNGMKPSFAQNRICCRAGTSPIAAAIRKSRDVCAF